MFDWIMQGALAKVANSDMAEARLTLVKLKILAEAPHAGFAYVDGVRKVAQLLSRRFELSVRDVVVGRGLNATQLDDAAEDLIIAAKRAGCRLSSDQHITRTSAQGYSFGCLLLHHLYRLRFLSERAPLRHRRAADDLADHYAQFCKSLADTPAGVQQFLRTYNEAFPDMVDTKSVAAA